MKAPGSFSPPNKSHRQIVRSLLHGLRRTWDLGWRPILGVEVFRDVADAQVKLRIFPRFVNEGQTLHSETKTPQDTDETL